MTDLSNTPYCVLMGDLVKSENSLPPHQLHSLFNAAVEKQNAAFCDELVSPLTITLGDEFQGLTSRLSQAIPIMRALRFDLMEAGVDCRFVIGLTEIKTALNAERAWNMMGPGLARARHMLDEKKSSTLYRFSLEQHPTAEVMLDALGAGLTVIERGWTRQQRKDIVDLMSGTKPAELARRRGVSVHSIYKVRSSGNFDPYVMQWTAIEVALAAIERKDGVI